MGKEILTANTHPIPVLASMGWKIPSSGKCTLFAIVSSATALDEFCSLLLSARFGSADALLDIIGRVNFDSVVNDVHVRTRNNPSDQGQSATCYAHAIAAVTHMALMRIVGREGGYPSIEEIRTRILTSYPPGNGGYPAVRVLQSITEWYRPLRFDEVNEDGARQAVLQRRPVLTAFWLSHNGWATFGNYFHDEATRASVLPQAKMQPTRSQPAGGGHAVVLVSCAPESLTFLNSWGNAWGQNGSFSVEGHTTLQARGLPMVFYNVYWHKEDLRTSEIEAY